MQDENTNLKDSNDDLKSKVNKLESGQATNTTEIAEMKAANSKMKAEMEASHELEMAQVKAMIAGMIMENNNKIERSPQAFTPRTNNKKSKTEEAGSEELVQNLFESKDNHAEADERSQGTPPLNV